MPDHLGGRVDLLTIDPAPRGPLLVNATAGSTVSKVFAMRTAKALSDVRFQLDPTSFLIDEAGLSRNISENSTTTFQITITVPYGLQSGTYSVQMRLYSAELFFGIPFECVVNVPGTQPVGRGPTPHVLSPVEGSFVRSLAALRIAVASDTPVQDAKLSVEGHEFAIVWNSDMAAWVRSEERRVGKECRSRWSPYH